eukprot:Gb_11445 [translate_table: standard]
MHACLRLVLFSAGRGVASSEEKSNSTSVVLLYVVVNLEMTQKSVPGAITEDWLRLLAEAKGYKLDDTGLFPVTRNSIGKKVAMASSSVLLKTEREVFDFLGFPWLEPHERNL